MKQIKFTKMATIQISKETKELIDTFGSKEDTYDDILKRIYKMAVKEQLHQFNSSSKNTISIDEAIQMINKN
jgi:hypothetical protein